uniref:AlNc14C71G4900 protein n=1 Tax=Albugo laibachii Nc14 TaxID=890382 RepID=F0WE39_9STRA|nr:AlNc14C71G4900 [Albugo laibachii Nc14]|eukprot:CCA19468.1 AlNc14C71G4900 [Albugo laibachii Nc14]
MPSSSGCQELFSERSCVHECLTTRFYFSRMVRRFPSVEAGFVHRHVFHCSLTTVERGCIAVACSKTVTWR